MSVVNLYRRDDQPFAQIPNQVIRDPQISSNAFRLLAYLMSHQDGYQLTYDQIERQTGLGRFAINQASQNLVSKGWLAVERPKLSNGQFGSKSWTVLNPAIVGHSTMEPHHMVPPTHIRRTLTKEEQVKEETLVQSSIERQRDQFEEFWQIYPRRQGKTSAMKALAKAVKLASFETIVEGARRYRDDPNRVKEFTAMPATWLNAGRWDDEPLPERQLTVEEKQARDREIAARKREVERLATEQMRRESEEARQRATPPPICEHGNKITSCRECLKSYTRTK